MEGRNVLLALPVLAPAVGPCSLPGAPACEVVPGRAEPGGGGSGARAVLRASPTPSSSGELLQQLLGEGWKLRCGGGGSGPALQLPRAHPLRAGKSRNPRGTMARREGDSQG